MWALVESGSITKMWSRPQAFKIGDNQYPANTMALWSESELQSIVSKMDDLMIPFQKKWGEKTIFTNMESSSNTILKISKKEKGLLFLFIWKEEKKGEWRGFLCIASVWTRGVFELWL